jgi:hypothetical protein
MFGINAKQLRNKHWTNTIWLLNILELKSLIIHWLIIKEYQNLLSLNAPSFPGRGYRPTEDLRWRLALAIPDTRVNPEKFNFRVLFRLFLRLNFTFSDLIHRKMYNEWYLVLWSISLTLKERQRQNIWVF